jgi:hypothetical protein
MTPAIRTPLIPSNGHSERLAHLKDQIAVTEQRGSLTNHAP